MSWKSLDGGDEQNASLHAACNEMYKKHAYMQHTLYDWKNQELQIGAQFNS